MLQQRHRRGLGVAILVVGGDRSVALYGGGGRRLALLLPNLIDVCLCEIQLLADVCQIRGDLRVERDLGFALLVARQRGFVKALQERLHHGFELSGGFRHGCDDVTRLSR